MAGRGEDVAGMGELSLLDCVALKVEPEVVCIDVLEG